MFTTLRAVLVTILLAAVASPAAATHNGEQPPAGCRWIRGTDTPEDHDDDVYACRQDVWIHHGGTRAGNIAALDQAPLPSWNTTPPAASLRDGGGVWLTNSISKQTMLPQNVRGSFVARGAFTGVLDNLAVDLYAYAAQTFTRDLNIELWIDDQIFYAGQVVGVQAVASNNLYRIRFAFTDLYRALGENNFPNGNATAHTIRISAGGVWVATDTAAFVYDASDAPAGVVFNHEAIPNSYTQLQPPEA